MMDRRQEPPVQVGKEGGSSVVDYQAVARLGRCEGRTQNERRTQQ